MVKNCYLKVKLQVINVLLFLEQVKEELTNSIKR